MSGGKKAGVHLEAETLLLVDVVVDGEKGRPIFLGNSRRTRTESLSL